MMEKRNEILEGKILPSLTKFAIPILFSLILQALYGAVDLWMVSRFGTNADVAAVSTGSQTMLIINGIVTGLSMGITIILGQAIGRKDFKEGADAIGTGSWIFAALALVFTVFLITAAVPLSRLLNAPAEAFDKTVHYTIICGAGTVFVVGYNVLNAIFCGAGDSKTPLEFVEIACLANIIGDFIFVEILKTGAAGAAIATTGAQALSFASALFIIRKKLFIPVKKENFRFSPKLAYSIIKLGTPIALVRMCTEISYLVIIGLTNKLGVIAASGIGIAEKLVMFILLIPTAYMSAVSAFTAQNTGAGQHARAKETLWKGMAAAGAICAVISAFAFLRGDIMSTLFTNDPRVIAASAEFLKATSIECFILSLAYCYDGYFNGIKKTAFVMAQGVAAVFLVKIPYAWYAAEKATPRLFDIGLATVYAALFMFITCTVYYLRLEKKNRSMIKK